MPSLMIRNLQAVVTRDDADSVLSQVDLYCEAGVLRLSLIHISRC